MTDQKSPLGTSKDDFLQGIQHSLGKSSRSPKQIYSHLQENLQDLEERANLLQHRLESIQPELLTTLADTASACGWHVYRLSTEQDALGQVSEIVKSKGIQYAVRSQEPIFDSLPIDKLLADLEINMTVLAHDSGLSTHDIREKASLADIGITGANYAIAETGSVVVLPRQGVSRLVSLMPQIHLAIVKSKQILENLEDLFLLRRIAFMKEENWGNYMNFITGPSRTGDIEQTIIVGVHGPKEVHLLILE